jgi:hypothetical protein
MPQSQATKTAPSVAKTEKRVGSSGVIVGGLS